MNNLNQLNVAEDELANMKRYLDEVLREVSNIRKRGNSVILVSLSDLYNIHQA